MKSICQQCKKEFDSERGTAKYCSDVCKKRYQRSGTDSGTKPNGTDSVTDDLKTLAPLKEITVPLEEVCTPQELQESPNMCQTKKEYKESVYRLENNDMELLKIHKVYIPGWREKTNKCPDVN